MSITTISPRNPERDQTFLEAIAAGQTVGCACDAAGYSRSAVYRYRSEDAHFRRAWAAAVECTVERLEEEADRRGRDGYEVPLYSKGEVVGETKKYSDMLLLARLKALAPHRYAKPESRYAVEGSRAYDFAGIAPPQVPEFKGYEPRPAEKYRVVEIATYLPCEKCDPERAAQVMARIEDHNRANAARHAADMARDNEAPEKA